MYSLADLNDIFFKINTSFEISPLFDLAASAEGHTQGEFLNAFYPGDFLHKVGKKSKEETVSTDQGIYFDKARRSKLFNGALPDSRKYSLRCEIIFSITLEEWGYIYKQCKVLCEKCSNEAKHKLIAFLDEVLETHKDYLPETMKGILCQPMDALDVKLALVMFLYLFLPLDVTPKEMQDDNLLALGKEIVEQLSPVAVNQNTYEILRYEDGYEYLEFGRYPQTYVSDEAICNALKAVEEKQFEEMRTLSMPESLNYLRACEKEAKIDGILIDGERYVRKTMYVNSFLDEIPKNYVFSDGVPVKAESYYCKIEPIKWRILDKKETSEGTELFLLSERILFNAFYNNHIRKEHGYVCQSGKEYAYSWEVSDLRDLLNSDFSDSFRNIAFTEEERDLMIDSTNDQTAGWYYHPKTTKDSIFVLSEEEASNYLFTKTEREYDVEMFRKTHGYEYPPTAFSAVGLLTDYALLSGVRPYDISAYDSFFRCPHYVNLAAWNADEMLQAQGRLPKGEIIRAGAYWLRSPSDKNARILDTDKELDYTRRVATITQGGSLSARGACVDGGLCEGGYNELTNDGLEIGVRPAMRILIKDAIRIKDCRNNPWPAEDAAEPGDDCIVPDWMKEECPEV